MAINFENPVPLYLQVVGEIKSRISSGKLNVGDRLESQHELSETYDVSLITIKTAIEILIQEGILFSRVGIGTFVARKSSMVHAAGNRTLGLVLRDLHSPFFSLIAQSVEATAYEHGFNILLSNSSGRAGKEEAQIQHFRKIGVSGLIIASMSHVYRATTMIKALQREQFPYVLVSYVEDKDIPFVGTDHETGGFLATEHLIKLGRERIGFVNGEAGNLVGELRRKGYGNALHRHGRRVDERYVFRLRLKGGVTAFESGYEIGQRFLSMRRKPDAVFVYNDISAIGLEQALLDGGMRIPEDIALVGFDNIERSQYAPVPLTTIEQPTTEIGARAVEILKQRIDTGVAPIRTIMKPRLLVRASCGGKQTKSRSWEARARLVGT